MADFVADIPILTTVLSLGYRMNLGEPLAPWISIAPSEKSATEATPAG